MIWRPYWRNIEVGSELFDILSNNLSIKCSWTSNSPWMKELWPSQWSIVRLPMTWKFQLRWTCTLRHICTYNQIMTCTCGTKWIIPKMTMQMVISEGVMSLSSFPSWQQTVLGLSFVGGQVVGSSQHCSPSWNLTCFFITKLRDLDMTWSYLLQPSDWSYCCTTKRNFRFEQI